MESLVTFVLVGTQSPGNLGAVCRLAKALRFPDVRLVKPELDLNADEARWLARNAEEVLANVPVFDSLPEALHGCFRSLATTARPRNWKRPVRTPNEAADVVADGATRGEGPWAIVFGPEDRGLSNEDLGHCDEIVTIPMPESPGATLSLPMAASVVGYALAERVTVVEADPAPSRERSERATRPLGDAELDDLLNRIHGTLQEIGFRPRPNELLFRGALRDFIARSRPNEGDRMMLRHLFAQVGKWKRSVEAAARRGEWE